MDIVNYYINGREKILARILQIDPVETLNSRRSPSPGISGGNTLAAEIKDSLNQIKSLAFTENGKVDYQKLVHDPLYQSYRELAGGLDEFDYKNLRTHDDALAFWINLYNALVIDGVIQENIQKSVTESRLGIMAFFQRAAYQVSNFRFSLTDIEHGLLRANRGFPYFPGPHFANDDPRLDAVIEPFDPRIHFALNCASNSCPPIGVYTPEKLDNQLDLATRNFIFNDLVIDQDWNTISISKIFRWYQVDFGGKKGILEFLGRYIKDSKIKLWMSDNLSSIRIQYHPYDWGLNKIQD